MKKLLVSDYDGTLLNDPAINRLATLHFRREGNVFVIATGRSLTDLLPSLEEHSFSYDYLILNHGAVILNERQELLWQQPFEEVLLQQLRSFFKEKNWTSSITYVTWNGIGIQKVVKIMIACENLREVIARAEQIKGSFEGTIRILPMPGLHDYLIELVVPTVSKKEAILWLCQQMSPSDVFTIGDGESDADMIAYFHGACMNPSSPCLKDLTDSCYNRVADYIDDLLK